MYSLELLWACVEGCADNDEYVVVVRLDDLAALKAIADDADFKAWARLSGAAFVEIWDGFDGLHHFRSCGK